MIERLTEKEIANLIQTLGFEPLKLTVLKQDYKIAENTQERVDFLLDIGWKNTSATFIVEIKKQGTPKKVEEAIYQLEKYQKKLSDSKLNQTVYPLIIAPFLSEKTLNLLIEKEISGIDLSGNGAVIVPGKLFVYRTGEKNKFPSSAPIKNVFSGVSSTIARVFLLKPEYESVGEVVNEINRRGTPVSFSTVSKVLKTLEEELLISRRQGIRLKDGKRLLNALRENYRTPQIKRQIRGKVADIYDALEQISRRAEREKIRYARNEPAKYAVMPPGEGASVKIYTESIDKLLGGIEFTETNRFPNMELIETGEPTVYFDLRQTDGFYWTSPLEIYLELAGGGKREQETAEGMVNELLNFKYDI